MHELSLLNEIVKTVERYARENPDAGIGADISESAAREPDAATGTKSAESQNSSITSLTLQVGELGSAVPEYLASAWSEAVSGTLLAGAELSIERVPAIARCRDCGAEFGFRETRGICPDCGGKNVTLLSGREFFIKEIAVE
jgi:hydrogenase nickel incorporation protein HypA/HybF